MAIKDVFAHPGANAALRLPESVDEPGILVGWSAEQEHGRQPIGFTFGDPRKTPATGYVDPILMAGEGHLITIASTGAGKGVGCVVPALLRYPGPVIVIDPKGENLAITARRRREMGQRIVVLDPLELTGHEPASLNPLDLVDALDPLGVDDAANLAACLLPHTGADRDTFWINRGRELLLGIICHVVTDLEPGERTLQTVREMVNGCVSRSREIKLALMESRHPEANRAADMLGLSAEGTVAGFVALAQEGIDVIRGPLVQRHTGRSSFSLDDVTRGAPLSIYIVVPPHMLEPLGRLLRLWISCLMTAIMRRRTKPEHATLFLLDEAAQLGPLTQLRQAITLLRGYGLQTWSFWQDASQLRRHYPHDWQTMINNCRAVQCFGANTMLAAEGMASIVGFADPARVLRLERDEMLLQLAGDEAVVAKVPNYRSDPAFRGLFDENPYYNAALDPMPLERKPIRGYIRERRRAEPQARPRRRRRTPRVKREANLALLARLRRDMGLPASGDGAGAAGT